MGVIGNYVANPSDSGSGYAATGYLTSVPSRLAQLTYTPAANETIENMGFYGSIDAAGRKLMLAVYDVTDATKSLVTAQLIAPTTTGQVQHWTLSGLNIPVLAGRSYQIATIKPAAAVNLWRKGRTGGMLNDPTTEPAPTPEVAPNPFPAGGSSHDYDYVIYANTVAETSPNPAKKIKFAGATAIKSASGALITHTYQHGALYSGELRVTAAVDYPDVVATFENIALTAGTGQLVEADCLTGSIDAMTVGEVIGDLWLWDADGSNLVIYKNAQIVEE